MKINQKKLEKAIEKVEKIIEEEQLSIYEVFVLLESMRVKTLTALFDASLSTKIVRLVGKPKDQYSNSKTP